MKFRLARKLQHCVLSRYPLRESLVLATKTISLFKASNNEKFAK